MRSSSNVVRRTEYGCNRPGSLLGHSRTTPYPYQQNGDDSSNEIVADIDDRRSSRWNKRLMKFVAKCGGSNKENRQYPHPGLMGYVDRNRPECEHTENAVFGQMRRLPDHVMPEHQPARIGMRHQDLQDGN